MIRQLAKVASFGAVGGGLGSGCAAGEVRPKIGLAAAQLCKLQVEWSVYF